MNDARSDQGSRRLALVAAAAVMLLGYLGGRAVFERAGALLAGHGVGAGLAPIALAPLYVGAVAAAFWAATRLVPSLGLVWASLKVSPDAARLLAMGLVGSAAMVAATYGADLAGGWVTARRSAPGAHWLLPLAAYCALYAIIAFNEELAFRGGLLEVLGRMGGRAWGTVGSSLLFAAVHAGGSTTWQRLAGLFLLGVLLAQAYLAARSLWLPIAMHWGVHVLGFAAALGLPPFRVDLSGPVGLIGRADELDAGWVMITVLALAVGALAWWQRSTARRYAIFLSIAGFLTY